MTTEKLIEELDRTVRIPGLTNIWIPPIRNRIDMLATGIKSPIGVKVAGSDLTQIDRTTQDIERAAKTVPGVTSALAERLTGGRYIDLDIERQTASRYGLNIADVQAIVAGAIGGETIGETVEGLARYPISVRYPANGATRSKPCANCRSTPRKAARSLLAPWPMCASRKVRRCSRARMPAHPVGYTSTCEVVICPLWSPTCARW